VSYQPNVKPRPSESTYSLSAMGAAERLYSSTNSKSSSWAKPAATSSAVASAGWYITSLSTISPTNGAALRPPGVRSVSSVKSVTNGAALRPPGVRSVSSVKSVRPVLLTCRPNDRPAGEAPKSTCSR